MKHRSLSNPCEPAPACGLARGGLPDHGSLPFHGLGFDLHEVSRKADAMRMRSDAAGKGVSGEARDVA